eukprot:jgi/Botrbrau1/19022/Bobra.0100s0052.2
MRHHFGGPAFLAWQRMGNLRAYGGPLPQSWIDSQAELQKRIVRRMREFGMEPVLPAFAGFVPPQLRDRVPQARISRLPNWGGFPPESCCVPLLDPLDPLFPLIGAEFVRAISEEYGQSKGGGFYAADTFNEMRPPTSDPAYLSSASAAVYQAMAGGDPQATWVMQGWLFYSERDFWHESQVEALIKGVPQGRLLILDLYAEVAPMWKATSSFFKAPFIWCMLHNFGGNLEMYGAGQSLGEGPVEAGEAEGSSLVGVGMCPEGIETNPVIYDLMSEWAFRRKPLDTTLWMEQYAVRRYGPEMPIMALQAWQILSRTVYSATDGHSDHNKDVPVSHPALSLAERDSQWGLQPHVWYNSRQLEQAWALLLECSDDLAASPTFIYDLVDVGRQVVSKAATGMWERAVQMYHERNLEGFEHAAGQLLFLLEDLDRLLATCQGFLFGPWIEDAKKAAGADAEQEILFLQNLKTQVTLWGSSREGGSEIEDYANREQAGLVSSYYLRRWQLWASFLRKSLESGTPYDARAWREQVLAFSKAWAHNTTETFPISPVGDAVAYSRALFNKYVSANQPLENNVAQVPLSCKRLTNSYTICR